MPGATSANSDTQLTRQEPWWVREFLRISEIIKRDSRLLSDEELAKVRVASSVVRNTTICEHLIRTAGGDGDAED